MLERNAAGGAPRLFFIVGPARSGSTLLERLLNGHSRIFIPPETEFFILLKQRGLLEGTFATAAARAFLAYYLDSRPARLLGIAGVPGMADRLLRDAQSWQQVFLNLLEITAEGDPRPLRGEKTPHHLRCADYLLAAFPGARFIAMIRDGRAVVRSRLHHPRWEHNLLDGARRWAGDARRIDALLRGPHRHRVLLLRYERLVAQPHAELQRVCTFLGESFEPAMLAGSASVPPRFEAYYRQPWMARSTSTIDPSRVHAWQADLTPAALALVEREAGPELERFGYPRLAPPGAPWRSLWWREWLRHAAALGRRGLGRLVRV